MDILEALDPMATTLANDESKWQSTVQRWMRLFNFTHADAEKAIQLHRQSRDSDISIAPDRWKRIHREKPKTNAEHDAESYQYWLNIQRPALPKDTQYLLKLDKFVGTVERVREVAKIHYNPPTIQRPDGSAGFCILDAHSMEELLWHLKGHNVKFTPVLHKSAEELVTESELAALNNPVDAYPLWFFFLADKADKHRLRSLFSGEILVFQKAWAFTPKDKTGPFDFIGPTDQDEQIEGLAMLVRSSGVEEELLRHEPTSSEVVRCSILLEDGEIRHGKRFSYGA